MILKNLMKNSLQEITINGYRTYVVLIDYDKDLPKNFVINFYILNLINLIYYAKKDYMKKI